MTDEKLQKAKDLQEQINKLEFFRNRFCDCHKKLIIRANKFRLCTGNGKPYIETIPNKRLTNRIEKAIDDEIKELKKEFEEL